MSSWFTTRREKARMLVPGRGPVERELEIRTHSLTGETARILRPPHRVLRVPDLRETYAHTRDGCPFCPESVEVRTPSFDPSEFSEPRLSVGEARVFPNLLAYAGLCALTVLSREHFVSLDGLSPPLLTDAFRAALLFFREGRAARPDLDVRLLHWNYMPPAGSSMIHPHHQLMATSTVPTRLARLAEGSRAHAADTGRNPWDDLVREEQKTGERWVGSTGPWSWVIDPVPRGRYFELIGVHDRAGDILDLDEKDLSGLVEGLVRAFSLVSDHGLWSFNLALMGLPDAADHFRCQVRLVPRAFLPPTDCADIHFDVIENEAMVLRPPEQVAEEARKLFARNR